MTEQASGRRTWLLLAIVTLAYAVGVTGAARARPFWYDEIYLLIAAKAPSVSAAWKTAVEIDANPPLPHVLANLAIRCFGLNEVTVRLPAMVGFWVFCLSLFVFVRRRKGLIFGFIALLLPIVTEAYSYAIDARAYGPLLGFSGIALVAWQSAAEGRRRLVALPLLTVSLAAILLCQYYGALFYLPLAAGELVRLRRSGRKNRGQTPVSPAVSQSLGGSHRETGCLSPVFPGTARGRIDWGVAAALALGTAPLVWRLASVLGTVRTFAHGWAGAYLKQGLEFWETGLQRTSPFLALFAFALALAAAVNRAVQTDREPEPVPPEEWTVGAALVCIPLIAVIAALTVTHAFTPRYGVLGLAGFCLLAPLLAAEYSGSRRIVGMVLAAVLGWGVVVTLADHGDARNPFTEETALVEALKQGPVVVSDGQLHLQMWHYAPPELKPRLVFLVDEPAAVKYMGFDTLDKGGGALKKWAGATSLPYSEFVAANRDFLLYRNLARPEWVTPRVLDEGASVEVRSVGLRRELVRVRMK